MFWVGLKMQHSYSVINKKAQVAQLVERNFEGV
jgi:hypothetical protein